MTEEPLTYGRPERAPTHLWLVGVLLVLWNGWGIALAIAAQTDRLPFIAPTASAYFGTQPLWFILLADLSPLAGMAGAVAILLQSRWAPWFFVAQGAILAAANMFELAVGKSLLWTTPESRLPTLVLFLLIFGEFLYARTMTRRGVLY